MTRLNPCVLCGNEPDLRFTSGPLYTVVCRCGLAVDVNATNGGSAINAWNDITANFTQPTKTLRDEFAMAALTGTLAANLDIPNSYKEFAEDAYKHADAMIKERNK